ncbi:MAG: hypothetical protein JW934_10920 [Anaerolineae bacterium]|nr:hypothetical protein [Anaerolineae bacterium]
MANRKRKRRPQSQASAFEIAPNISIVSIPAKYTSGEGATIEVAKYAYQITNPDGGSESVEVSSGILSSLGAAKGLLRFGFKNPSLADESRLTWPDEWKYITEEQCDKLASIGRPIKREQGILLESLDINSFGAGLYYAKNIDQFFDAWIEIIWQEYVVETELRRYKALKSERRTVVINRPGEFNLQVANTWICLENCAVRIRSIWERLKNHVLPLYFTGALPDSTNKQYWHTLNVKAKELIGANDDQLEFYDGLVKLLRDVENSPLKRLRDAVIHSLSYRPPGGIPPSSISESGLPQNVGDMHKLILQERSRTREALVLMATIIKLKTPVNEEVS